MEISERNSPRTSLPWPDPSGICDELLRVRRSCSVLYFELAPTGLVHPGILRLMLRIDYMRKRIAAAGLGAVSVLGLDDRCDLKSSRYLSNGSPYIGTKITEVPSPESGFDSYFAWSVAKIREAIVAYGISFDRYELNGDLYRTSSYRELIARSLRHREQILRIIGKFQTTEPLVLSPLVRQMQKNSCRPGLQIDMRW